MKSLYRIVILVVACVGAAALASAQTPSNVLHKLRVQKLVAAETPVANLALAAHFNAIADRYLEDARQHATMATTYKVNANRSSVTNAGTHCERLAEVAKEWAAAARLLARYHVDLAAGRAALLPIGASALHGGRGAPEPTAQQLHQLALTARTRSDHLVLEEYFTTVARKKAAEADVHAAMATGLRAGIRKGWTTPHGIAIAWRVSRAGRQRRQRNPPTFTNSSRTSRDTKGGTMPGSRATVGGHVVNRRSKIVRARIRAAARSDARLCAKP